jgi:hypothetical protein
VKPSADWHLGFDSAKCLIGRLDRLASSWVVAASVPSANRIASQCVRLGNAESAEWRVQEVVLTRARRAEFIEAAVFIGCVYTWVSLRPSGVLHRRARDRTLGSGRGRGTGRKKVEAGRAAVPGQCEMRNISPHMVAADQDRPTCATGRFLKHAVSPADIALPFCEILRMPLFFAIRR